MVIPNHTPAAADLFQVFLFQFEQDYQRAVTAVQRATGALLTHRNIEIRDPVM